MHGSSTTHACSRSQHKSILIMNRGCSVILGSVLLTLAVTACIGPVKPVPTQQSQEASSPTTETAESSKPMESVPSAAAPSKPIAPVVPLLPIGVGQPTASSGNEDIPVIEAKPVFVTAQRESYTVTHATTATKTDTPLMETPAAVQVIPRQVIQDQRANRLQDVLQNVSGVRSNNNDLEGYVYKLRGFTSLDLYRNGLRVPGGSSQPTIAESANLERVEVVKGPASVLFGRAEPGGLINLVTKRPLMQPYYKLEQEFGSYNHYRGRSGMRPGR
jgi:iron complex outermembrane receptor protein